MGFSVCWVEVRGEIPLPPGEGFLAPTSANRLYAKERERAKFSKRAQCELLL